MQYIYRFDEKSRSVSYIFGNASGEEFQFSSIDQLS